jgi:hypothetical protein
VLTIDLCSSFPVGSEVFVLQKVFLVLMFVRLHNQPTTCLTEQSIVAGELKRLVFRKSRFHRNQWDQREDASDSEGRTVIVRSSCIECRWRGRGNRKRLKKVTTCPFPGRYSLKHRSPCQDWHC